MKLFLTLLFSILFFSIFAQVPQKMSYQAVIRNTSNTILSNTNISVRISLIKSDSNGYPVYIETHNTNTNINGLITLQIGGGLNFFGNFSSIDWSAGPFFIETEIDPDGGFDYRITGITELLSVPYALFAAKSIFDTTNIYNSINKLELQSITNKNNIQTNLDSIQSKLSLVDFSELIKSYQKIGKFVSAISLQGVDSFDVNINGNFIASKNVTIGGNIESLGATSTLGTLEKPFKGLFISSGSLSIASDTLGQNVPAAVLSNVEGNLQISAGGLKLMGENTSFIAPRIISNLTGNATSATKFETSRLVNGVVFDGTSDINITSTATNRLFFSNNGSGDATGDYYNGSLPKTISYNTIGAVASNVVITGSTKTKLSYDSKGLVTGGADATTADIAASTNKNYVTDLQVGVLSNTSGTNSGDESVTTIKTKLGITTLSGSNTGDQTNIIGNAGTASKLVSSKLINGVAFDGSADITIATTSANALTYTNTGNGDFSGGSYDGSLAKTISFNSVGAVGSNQAIIGATKTKLTYDAKGLITEGADATTADILVSANKNYVTDLQAGVLSNTSGINTGDQINIIGNAATATYATTAGTASSSTKLAIARNINNVAFDGTTDISITAIADAGTLSGTTLNATITGSSLTSVGTLSNLTVTNPIAGSITGNAATATYATTAGTASTSTSATYATSAGTASKATILETARNINGVSFNGSSDISITAIADAGTLSGTTLNATITGSSLTSVGTLSTGVWSATAIGIAHGGTNTIATPTAGTVVYGTGTAQAYTAAGTSGQFLQSAGAGTPVWVAPPGPTSVVILTSLTPSSTYTVSTGVKAIMIELVGGGGGTGAITGSAAANTGTVSGGGGSGSYTRLIISSPSTSYTYTVGAGGTAAASGSPGNNGGTTNFGGIATANGGTGGALGPAAVNTGTVSAGGAGGAIGTGGSLMIPGNVGGTGISTRYASISGAGGNSYFGGGANSVFALPAATTKSGLTPSANSYGSGASGAVSFIATGTGSGAAGFQGVIIITEFK